jgi:uncharacterized membrane protein YozB (DUF420 family)
MASPTRPRAPAAWLAFAVGTVVAGVLITPYLGLDRASSRLEVDGDLQYGLLVAHILTAAVALVLGPLQFVPAVRARRRWHRRIGRAYLLAGVVPSAVTAIPVALLSGRPLTQVGLTIPAVGWLVTAGLAVRAIRRRDPEAHRSWMTRNYALTFLAVTSRALVPLMLLASALLTGTSIGSLSASVPDLIPVGQVLGWVVNLAVAEVLIRRRAARIRAAGPPPPDGRVPVARSLPSTSDTIERERQ